MRRVQWLRLIAGVALLVGLIQLGFAFYQAGKAGDAPGAAQAYGIAILEAIAVFACGILAALLDAGRRP